jgi:hypothetical protein
MAAALEILADGWKEASTKIPSESAPLEIGVPVIYRPIRLVVPKAGSVAAPRERKGMLAVALGDTFVIVAVPAPTRTAWFVRPVSWTVSVFAEPATVIDPVPKRLKFPEFGTSTPPLLPVIEVMPPAAATD